MQHRMKEFTLPEKDINHLLETSEVGRISTNGLDGYPYTVAVHFIYLDGFIYFHGLPQGEKLDNIKNDNRVCFEIDEFTDYLTEDLAVVCDVDSVYKSVVVRGDAEVVEDMEEKARVLKALIKKLAPQLSDMPMPEARIQGTAVVRIKPVSITGKYHE